MSTVRTGDESPGAPARESARRKRSFETWSWFFMRLSGLALVFLALIHFTITHIANDVVTTNYAFVAERWDNPLWRLFDWSLLALALAHGLTGLRRIIDDYVRRPPVRRMATVALFGLSGALLLWGTFTIATF